MSFTNNPTGLVNGIIQQGVIESAGAIDFATYDSSPEGFAVVPLPASAYVTDISLASTTSNVKLSSSVALTTSKNINALLLGPNVVVSGVDANLTVAGGNVILGNNANLSASHINFGAGGMVYVPNSASASIDGNIYNAGTLRKNGAGKLTVTGDNQFTGQTQVNEGVLNVQRSGALGSNAGDATVRQGATLELEQTTFGPLVIGLENIAIAGTGVANTGALRNVAGNNSFAGNLTVTADTGNSHDLLLKYDGWMGTNSLNNAFSYADFAANTRLTITGTWNNNNDLVKLAQARWNSPASTSTLIAQLASTKARCCSIASRAERRPAPLARPSSAPTRSAHRRRRCSSRSPISCATTTMSTCSARARSISTAKAIALPALSLASARPAQARSISATGRC